MEFIAGFRWPLPRAFAGAVLACRFEQGDVIYSDAGGYRAWSKGRGGAKFAVQVLDPPKSTRALAPGSEGKRFDANWNSAVEIEVTDYRGNSTVRQTTTQGRLFYCLWRGDTAWLDPEGKAAIPPASQRELHRRLGEAQPAFERHYSASGSDAPLAEGFSLYLAAVDDANENARSKAQAVRAALEANFRVESHWLSPQEAGLPAAEELHPALRIQGLAVAAQRPEAVEEQLRRLLYRATDDGTSGGRERGQGDAGEPGRFSLARHGLLVEVRAR